MCIDFSTAVQTPLTVRKSGDRLAPQPIVLASVQSVSVGGGTTRGVPEDRRDGSVHGLMEAFSSVESSSGRSQSSTGCGTSALTAHYTGRRSNFPRGKASVAACKDRPV